MLSLSTLMAIFIPLAIVISIFASLFQYATYPNALARWSALVLASIAADLTCYFFILTGSPPVGGRALAVLQAASFLLLDVSYLVFVIYFTGHQKRLTGRMRLGLIGLPALILGLMVFQWGALPAVLDARAFGFGIPTHLGALPVAPYAWLFIGFSHGVGFFSVFLLVRMLLNSPAPYRQTILGLIAGTALILGAGVGEILGATPLPGVSMLQTAVALCVFPIFLIVFTWKTASAIPISQQLFKDTMRDGYVILDAQDTVLDYNLALHSFLGEQVKITLGAPLADLAPNLALALKPGPAAEPGRESPILIQREAFIYEAVVYPIGTGARPHAGRMVVLHNVTDRDQMEATVRQNNIELSRSNAFFASLASLTLSLQTASGLNLVLDTLGQELRRLGLKCFVALYPPQASELTVRYISENIETIRTIERTVGREILGFGLDRKLFSALYGALETRQIRYLPDEASGLALFLGNVPGWIMDPLIKSAAVGRQEPSMIIPLLVGENILGLLGVWGSTLQAADITPFQIFGSQLGWAIEKAMLQAVEARRLEELAHAHALVTALSKLSAELESAPDNDAALAALGEALAKLDLSCAVVTLDDAKETGMVRYVSIKPDVLRRVEQLTGFNVLGYQIPKRLWPGQTAITDGVPVWYANAEVVFSRIFPNLPAGAVKRVYQLFRGSQAGQLCFVPLRVQGDVIGVMPIWGHTITPSDGPTLSIFGDQVAAMLRRNTSYQDEIRKSGELGRLNSMVMALSGVAAQLDSTTDLSQVLATLGQELRKVRLSSMVGTLDAAQQVMTIEHLALPTDVAVLARSVGLAWPGDLKIPRRLWPTDKAVTDKVPSWDPQPLGKIYRMFPYIPQDLFDRALRLGGLDLSEPMCYLPMINEEVVIGILAVWGAELKNEDIPALSIFATQLATAIKNAELYAKAQTEIAERTQAEARIRAALTEKEVLLKEVHHRVKNNLQIISSLLNLQMAGMADPKIVETLKESQNRVRSMALIHEKLYQSDDLASIDFSAYLRSLVYSLVQSYRVRSDKVALHIHVDPLQFDLDTAIPCGLIVNELVSNSIKYAFPNERSGQIEVACRQRPDQRYTLVVRDDGVGLPAGFDSAQTSSLGMKLVRSLVLQIGGELKVEGGHGTRFEINFAQPEADA